MSAKSDGISAKAPAIPADQECMTDSVARPDLTGCSDALGTIAGLLWRERDCLQQLLFRLTEQQHLITAGEIRWLHLADADVRAAGDASREAELIRAAETDLFARQFGLPVDISLRELSALVPEPWDVVLADHAAVMRALALEIESVVAANTRMLKAGQQAVRESIERLSGAQQQYTPRGASASIRGAALLDEHA